MATKTLYVGNLPYSSNEEDLLTYFAAYSPQRARIVEGRGFGFVDVAEDQMEAAIADKHNSEMGGRKLTVNEARPREPRSGGGGGYGGGGYGGGGGQKRGDYSAGFGGGGFGKEGGDDRGDRDRGGRGKSDRDKNRGGKKRMY